MRSWQNLQLKVQSQSVRKLNMSIYIRLIYVAVAPVLYAKTMMMSANASGGDELSPLIERIFDADSLLIAAPIFFSHPASHYMALLERLIFSLVSYKTGNKFKGKVNVGLFYTINSPRDYFEKYMRPQLKQSEDLLGMLNGEVVIESFSNIPKSLKSDLSEDELNSKEDQLSQDLKRVFEIAADLSG